MAAVTAAGLDGLRMEEKKLEYFSSINSMAKKIMQEREKIKSSHGPSWDRMTPQQQDAAIDDGMMEPHIRARYAMHRVDRDQPVCYPKLLLQTGQKIVHFGEEDITWQDEHSAPFTWETKSQLDFSFSSPSGEPGLPAPPPDPKTTKTTPKTSLSDGRRTDEESSFWKISAERSRLEGQADFQSLTPSQIKSIEKGEKPLPSYLRQDVPSKEVEPAEVPPPAPSRSTKQRAPRPPAPPPPAPPTTAPPLSISPGLAPPLSISPGLAPPLSITPGLAPPISISPGLAPPISISPGLAPPLAVSPSGAGWERSQSTLPSVAPDNTFSSLTPKTPNTGGDKDKGPEGSSASPTFAQFNTSSNILKTGFDFLDNW